MIFVKNKMSVHQNDCKDENIGIDKVENKKHDRGKNNSSENKEPREKKKKRKINIKNMTLLLIFLIAMATLAAVAFFGILLVDNQSVWYLTLDIPWEQPDDYVFLLAWGINYLLFTASFFIALKNRLILGKIILSSYIVNLFLYVTWLSAFFVLNRADVALFTIIAMMTTLYIIIRGTFRNKLICSILCMPYGIILVIALCMNYVIVILN